MDTANKSFLLKPLDSKMQIRSQANLNIFQTDSLRETTNNLSVLLSLTSIETPTPADLSAMARRLAATAAPPLFSVVFTIYQFNSAFDIVFVANTTVKNYEIKKIKSLRRICGNRIFCGNAVSVCVCGGG